MSDASQHPDAGQRPDATPPAAEAPYAWSVEWPAPPRPPRPPRRPGRAAAVAAVVALAVAAAGVPLGLLWAAIAPTVPVRMTDNGAVLVEAQPEEFAAADAWFSILGLAFGVLAALAVWRFAQRWRGSLVLAALSLGAVGAGALAWWLGTRLGTAEYERLLDSAAPGTVFGRPVDLRAADADLLFGFLPVVRGDVLVPALGAAVAYTLLAGWSRYASLRPHEEPYPPDDPFSPTAPFDAPEPTPFDPASAGGASASQLSSGPVSWDSTARPAPPAAPEPPESGAAAPPRG